MAISCPSLRRIPVPSLLALASIALGGCTIDGPDACDAHQVYRRGGRALDYAVCICDEADGYVFDEQRGHGCKRCAAGQAIVNGRCATMLADAGSQEPDAMRVQPATGVGSYCDTDADCAAFDAKFCAVPTHSCLISG